MAKFSNILVPSIVGITVYLLVSKFFPEKFEKLSDINPQKDFRGGDIVNNKLIQVIKKIVDKIWHDRALKIALISVFTVAGSQYYLKEIQELLVDDVFNEICVKEVNGQLKIVCDTIKEHELNLHSTSIKKLIISTSLSRNDKIKLLKIKLDFIINGECTGKRRFLIVAILAALITVCFSGVTGLAMFLEALYQLFQEGKISRALYKQLLEIIKDIKDKLPVPIEHLL